MKGWWNIMIIDVASRKPIKQLYMFTYIDSPALTVRVTYMHVAKPE